MAIEPLTCFAIAAPGLESIVARELEALGERPRVDDGGVSWDGDARSLMRANLWLRSASRVLVRVATFKATAFFELEKRAKKIPWERFVAPGANAEFRVTARKSKLYHSDAIAERLQGAASSRLRAAASKPPKPTAQGQQLFVVRVFRDEFVISADTSGELLHMRGYRQAVGKAPLRETLAAALLLGSEWAANAPLLDPFCGSGTIPIEAALIARRIAPGHGRRFAFMEWPLHEASVWRKLVADAKAGALARSPVPIHGSDRDAGAITASRANADRAGVAEDIDFDARAVSAIEPRGATGLVATNPPYGIRVGERSALRDLYARFGQVLRERFANWRVAMYGADSRLTAQVGLEFHELFQTTNGGIKVTGLLAE